MPKEIDYGRLMHKALRQLISEVLAQVSRNGLPGDHHFYITFDTRHPGVDMAPSLKARYPEEMTIVMQDWFADLAVMKDRFSVTLNFGNVPEPIVIPFDAIKTFVDPSVEFGLRFDAHEEGAARRQRRRRTGGTRDGRRRGRSVRQGGRAPRRCRGREPRQVPQALTAAAGRSWPPERRRVHLRLRAGSPRRKRVNARGCPRGCAR
jgi:uncharacterized protein